MNRWQQIETIFDQVVGLPHGAQMTALVEACGTDWELLEEIKALLEADRSAGALLEVPALEMEAHRLAREFAFPTGSLLGDYRIEQLIAAGGSAAVYRATDLSTGLPAALKVFPTQPGMSRVQKRRFRREVRAIEAMNDPRVPKLYTTGEEGHVRYLAEEYVDGRTLQELMRGRNFSSDELMNLAIQIAEVLAVAHAKGIVHRDIKPVNLMITKEGHLKVLDFGIVKFTESVTGASEMDSCTDTLTQEGTVLGTFEYMSPEQLMGERVDHRTDLFSLGLTIYELATGRNPFQTRSLLQRIAALGDWKVAPVGRLVSGLDPRLAKVIDRCLRRFPYERYRSAGELLEDLAASR